MSETLQYIIVFLIIVGAAVAVVLKLVRLRSKGKFDACCGCSLSGSCSKKNLKKHNQCDENNKNLE